EVTVEMGQTRYGPDAVAFNSVGLESSSCGEDTLWHLPVPGQETVLLSLVGISNPHAVMVVEDVATAPVLQVGSFIESHERIVNRVNFSCMNIVDRIAV